MNQVLYKQNYPQPEPKKNNIFIFFLKRLVIFLLVIGVIGGIGYEFIIYKSKQNKSPAVYVDSNASAYSAVFLNNGQVYFGKIVEIQNGYLTLSDIYYISSTTKQPINQNTAASDLLSLVKLGQEIHGPTDVIFINSSNILFYEHLRSDSRVVQSIEKSKSGATQ